MTSTADANEAPTEQTAKQAEADLAKMKPDMTKKEWETAKNLYFDRCAGCHGMLRKGATGPNLEPDKVRDKYNQRGLEAMITYGSPGGMPALGKQGILSDTEVNLVARYIQHEPPEPPEMSMADIKETHKVFVPEDERPTRPAHDRNWENFFGVILRDAGKVAIIDGDTKELVNVVKTGYAVHILRSSADGRYFYVIGRDGLATLIDLWAETPQKVAEVKIAYDARSIESSKYHGPEGDYRGKYAIAGGYWPPHQVIMDGMTLEPLNIKATTEYSYDEGKFLRENRVAAIVASHKDPYWISNLKESGHVQLMDYTDPQNITTTDIEAERYLHDGGWDSSKRYVLMAANQRDRIAVIDTFDEELESLVDVGTKPHPGRGANIDHPEYGTVWATGHIGESVIKLIGTDPENHPEHAWEVVDTYELPTDGGGNLFIKTHPNSDYLYVDQPLHPNADANSKLYIFDKYTGELVKTYSAPEEFPGKIVHTEFDQGGDEAWISIWSGKGKKSGIVVLDDDTLEVKDTITGDWLVTPTGKFNVHNTMKDIY